jgi:cytochrome c oxidase subunit 2
METSSPFTPRSPQALAIERLFNLNLAIGAIIFLLVTGLVIYISYRFRARPGQGEPRQIAGNRRLEIAWTIAPALILVVIFGLTLVAMRTADPPVGQQRPDLRVIGHQWWWEVQYPNSGVITANEIHIPTGKPLLVQLEAADVIHDFWVPQLGPKRDMVPGKTNYIWMQADRPGTYSGACSEYCGVQHAWMRILAIAQPQAAFDAWQQQQLRGAPSATGGDVAQGAKRFQQMTCVNCHAIGGTTSQARIGPDLTHLASRQTLAAGLMQNTPENLTLWMKNPQAVKPGTYMPNLQLSDNDVRALVAYMETLK